MPPFVMTQEAKLLFDRFTDPTRSALELLLYAAGIHEYLDQVMPAVAKHAREEDGHSCADVGEVLHITRQAAYQRSGKPFTYFDGSGGYQVVDPSSSTYIETLRQVRDALHSEGRREDDVRLNDDYLEKVGAADAP